MEKKMIIHAKKIMKVQFAIDKPTNAFEFLENQNANLIYFFKIQI